jgi:hypothetical protein
MGLAVLLPGRAYPVDRPAIAAVGDAVAAAGYDVLPVSWGLLDEVPPDPDRWVVERLVEAAPGGCDLVVGKSLSTRAASYVAGRGWPAVWVTPLLREGPVVSGIRANPAPQLLVCGGADPLHDPAVATDLAGLAGGTCVVLELPGLDHSLSGTGDHEVVRATVARVEAATAAFLAGLA